jgi:6,7-dimethyl-8-ribityllumazine synthase
MSESEDRFSGRDPFDDREDWPYREAPTPQPREPEREPSLTRYGSPEPLLPEGPPPAPEPGLEPMEDVRAGDSAPLAETRLLEEIEEDVAVDTDEPVAADSVETPVDSVETPLEEVPEVESIAAAVALDEAASELEQQHAEGELDIPAGHVVVEGAPNGFRRTVAVVIARFNGDVTNRLLASALDALEAAHVAKDAITIVPVPGAFELPLAAMALAKTRRFSCVVALGCVIRGETPHFDFVAGEAASGLQLAAIETGIPVSFGVLTCESLEQAEARVGKGAEAAQAALEMADLFSQVRTRASS